MSLARVIKRNLRIVAFLRENAVEIVSALYACDRARLAQCLASQLGMTEADWLDGSPRPPAQPPRPTAADALRAHVIAELAKHGLTVADFEKIRAARDAERELKRRKAKEAKERSKAADLERKGNAS